MISFAMAAIQWERIKEQAEQLAEAVKGHGIVARAARRSLRGLYGVKGKGGSRHMRAVRRRLQREALVMGRNETP